MRLRTVCLSAAVLLGLGNLANGGYMLVAPSSWYFAVPGVTTTGPFNQHFIRDIGLAFVFTGAAFVIGARRAPLRTLLWSAASCWLAGHALFHVWEVAVGICGLAALSRDFPGVTLPAILGVSLTSWAFADARAVRTSRT